MSQARLHRRADRGLDTGASLPAQLPPLPSSASLHAKAHGGWAHLRQQQGWGTNVGRSGARSPLKSTAQPSLGTNNCLASSDRQASGMNGSSTSNSRLSPKSARCLFSACRVDFRLVREGVRTYLIHFGCKGSNAGLLGKDIAAAWPSGAEVDQSVTVGRCRLLCSGSLLTRCRTPSLCSVPENPHLLSRRPQLALSASKPLRPHIVNHFNNYLELMRHYWSAVCRIQDRAKNVGKLSSDRDLDGRCIDTARADHTHR
jgi:hypothetical protein